MPASPQSPALRAAPSASLRFAGRPPEPRRPLLRGLAFAVPASLLAWGVILTPLVLPHVDLG
jgi:hypothetical protein